MKYPRDKIIREKIRGKIYVTGLLIEGVQKGLKEWADLVGLDPNSIRYRIGKGMTLKEAVFKTSDYSGPHDPFLYGPPWPVHPSVVAQTRGKGA